MDPRLRGDDGRAVLIAAAFLVAALLFTNTHAQQYHLGRPATAAEIAAWDIDVRPDGHGIRQGSGSVAQGQQIYDAKCASCHGTFGESNSYLVIAGGVEPEDLSTGRARRLKDADVMRTLGNKLNSATTLWDYINRAMPWTQPRSLTVDEVYAVTAYVLHLNGIVPSDFELNATTLLHLQMPNRNGMTTAHGMLSTKGKPDVQGSSCMTACGPMPRITSRFPSYARNVHGNLAQQVRPFGPFKGINTADEAADDALIDAKSLPLSVPELLAQQGCSVCHALENRVIGPSWREVVEKYRGATDAPAQIAQNIRQGGVGRWGQIPMPPQAALTEPQAEAIARWISSGAP